MEIPRHSVNSMAPHFPAGTSAPWKPMDIRVAWQPIHCKRQSLNLARIFTNNMLVNPEGIIEQCIGYAACYLVFPKDMELTMAVGSDDGYRIWLDDKVVAEKIVYRGAQRDQEKYSVKISKGTHRLLVKILNDIGGHELYLRFFNKNEKPELNYTIKLAP